MTGDFNSRGSDPFFPIRRLTTFDMLSRAEEWRNPWRKEEDEKEEEDIDAVPWSYPLDQLNHITKLHQCLSIIILLKPSVHEIWLARTNLMISGQNRGKQNVYRFQPDAQLPKSTGANDNWVHPGDRSTIKQKCLFELAPFDHVNFKLRWQNWAINIFGEVSLTLTDESNQVAKDKRTKMYVWCRTSRQRKIHVMWTKLSYVSDTVNSTLTPATKRSHRFWEHSGDQRQIKARVKTKTKSIAKQKVKKKK